MTAKIATIHDMEHLLKQFVQELDNPRLCIRLRQCGIGMRGWYLEQIQDDYSARFPVMGALTKKEMCWALIGMTTAIQLERSGKK